MTGVVVVFVTAPDEALARSISTCVVEEGLAACATRIPGVRSVYRWEGATVDEAEVLLMFKTRTERVEALTARILGLHPYAVPEVIAVPVVAGNAAYLAWVRA